MTLIMMPNGININCQNLQIKFQLKYINAKDTNHTSMSNLDNIGPD